MAVSPFKEYELNFYFRAKLECRISGAVWSLDLVDFGWFQAARGGFDVDSALTLRRGQIRHYLDIPKGNSRFL